MSSKLLSVFLYLSCFIAIGHARPQEVLHRILKAKLNGDSEIDRSSYNKVQINKDRRILLQDGLKENDEIKKLPGQPGDVTFKQYGGYVPVDEKNGRNFYYYFVEAESAKESKPLLLWLNGGPGCSSIGYGAMQEHGPFRVGSDGKTLYKNPYSWNKLANVLYLESPHGTGFSYSDTQSDYDQRGDRMTGNDNHAFLVNWFKRFPEYAEWDLYISGESYAGHYVPELADTILKDNAQEKNAMNIKGFLIGNPVLQDETDSNGIYDFQWSHSLISDKTHTDISKKCNFEPSFVDAQSKECNQAIEIATSNVNSLDIYDIYAPVCHSNLTDKPKPASTVLDTWDPCMDQYVQAYMNNPEVQKALHANVAKVANNTWEPCRDILPWTDSPSTVMDLIENSLLAGLRVWVFSGDTDAKIPVTATRYSLNSLNLTVEHQLYPWFLEKEVAGFAEVYKMDERALMFATVKGAGHQVPSSKPAVALSLLQHFFDATFLPTGPNPIVVP